MGAGRPNPKLNVPDVAHQEHYEHGEIQPIEYMQAIMPPAMFEGYLWGNILKYTSRYNWKNGVEDLEKAQVYLGWLIQQQKGQKVKP